MSSIERLRRCMCIYYNIIHCECVGVCVQGCVGVGEWVHRFCAEKCTGRLSAKLQLLSLQLVACTGIGTLLVVPLYS